MLRRRYIIYFLFLGTVCFSRAGHTQPLPYTDQSVRSDLRRCTSGPDYFANTMKCFLEDLNSKETPDLNAILSLLKSYFALIPPKQWVSTLKSHGEVTLSYRGGGPGGPWVYGTLRKNLRGRWVGDYALDLRFAEWCDERHSDNQNGFLASAMIKRLESSPFLLPTTTTECDLGCGRSIVVSARKGLLQRSVLVRLYGATVVEGALITIGECPGGGTLCMD